MKRLIILPLVALLAVPVAAQAKNHHRIPTHLAAAPQCFTAPPEEDWEQTSAFDTGAPDFNVSIGRDARYWCSQRWRVEAQPLYRAVGAATWSVGFTNKLYEPSPTTTYGSGVDKLFDVVTGSPGAFTGYWDQGDGLKAARPLTQWEWRVRFRFFNSQDVQIATLYSPNYTP